MLKRLVLVLALCLPAPLSSAATLGDDGLHKEDWFSITFRDIAEDIETIEVFGTRLTILLRDPDRADETRVIDTGVRGIAKLPDRRIHLLTSGNAEAIEGAIRSELTARI